MRAFDLGAMSERQIAALAALDTYAASLYNEDCRRKGKDTFTWAELRPEERDAYREAAARLVQESKSRLGMLYVTD